MAISQSYVYLIKYLAVLLFTSGVLAETDFTTVGTSCKLSSGGKGKCVRAAECPEVTCGYIYGVDGTYCEEKNNEYVVCCNQTTSLSKRACSRYNKYHIIPSIRGGENIRSEEFPYLALLGFVKKLVTGDISKPAWLCSGVLISEKYVLTAAHCTTNPLNGQLTKVKLVGHIKEGITFDVEDIIPHDSFRPPERYGDIALIKLLRSVKISQKIWPPCISNARKEAKDQKLIVLGWDSGYDNSTDEEIIPIPQKAWQTMMSNKKCTKELGNDAIIQLPNKLQKSMFCTVNETSDTCRGDSGGPIVRVEDKHILVGITSFGYDPCLGKRPSIYTSVSYYRNWIECIVWPNEKNATNATPKA